MPLPSRSTLRSPLTAMLAGFLTAAVALGAASLVVFAGGGTSAYAEVPSQTTDDPESRMGKTDASAKKTDASADSGKKPGKKK